MNTKHRRARLVAFSLVVSATCLGCDMKANNCDDASRCPPSAEGGNSSATSQAGNASNGGGGTTSSAAGNATSQTETGGTTSPTSGGATTTEVGGAATDTGGTNSSSTATATGGSSPGSSGTSGGTAGTTTSLPCNGTCAGAAPICAGATNTCVECESSSDCKEATASRCNIATNACVGCQSNDDCTSIPGRGVCSSGTCVQCTGAKHDVCGKLGDKALVCDSLQHTCTTDKTIQSADLCFPCVSDDQCMPGRRCLQQTFQGQPVGHYCFWKQGDTVNGAPADCALTGRPYVKPVTTTTIDGEAGTFCMLAVSTCPAVNQFRSTNCAPAGVPDSGICGFAPGQDSTCAEFGSSQHRCTMVCLSDDDCKSGSSCPLASKQYCSLN